jgi:adenylate cyclase
LNDLFDVLPSTLPSSSDEEGTLAALKQHRQTVFDPAVAAHQGRIVKLIGDGTIVEFASLVDALNCALSVRRSGCDDSSISPVVRDRILKHRSNLADVRGDDAPASLKAHPNLHLSSNPGRGTVK